MPLNLVFFITIFSLFLNDCFCQEAFPNNRYSGTCELRSDQNYLDTNRVCMQCPDRYKANRTSDSCYQLNCNDNQFHDRLGACVSCPYYNHPDSDKTTCVQDDCESMDIIDIEGYCQRCPAFSRPDDGATACVSSECGLGKIIKADGECASCPDYQRPDQFGQSCITDDCVSPQVLIIDGTCENCYLYSRPAQDGRTCISDSCSSNQIKKLDGTCSDCWDYSRPDFANRECISDSCQSNEVKTTDGTCFECSTYSRPNDAGLNCIQDSCSSTQILVTDGKCNQCPDQTRPSDEATSCISDSCSSWTQTKSLTGFCETCGDYTRPNSGQTKCIQDLCSSDQINLMDGRCQNCPSQKRPDSTGKNCIDATCSSTQYRNQIGNCQECVYYSRPNDAGNDCITDTCTDLEYMTILGQCIQCDDYTRRDDDGGLSCRSFECSDRHILLIDGTCEQCPDYSKPNDDEPHGKQCISQQCSSTQVLTTAADCETCGDYSRPNDSGTNCIQDSCSQTQIRTMFGTCQECYTYTKPDQDGTYCVSDEVTNRAQESQVQKMQSYFGTEPNWQMYKPNSEQTMNVKTYFFNLNRYAPSGSILGPLHQTGRMNINTPIMNEMEKVSTIQTYNMDNIQLQPNNDKIKLDLVILSENLDTDQIQILWKTLAGQKCCWQEDNEAPNFSIMVTGYARIITYHEDLGILKFQEGHFYRGQQDNFGRLSVQKESVSDGISQYMFTGWFPDETNTGLGFSMVENRYLSDKFVTYTGEWQPRTGFPNNGYDFIYPYPFEEAQIQNSWRSYRETEQIETDGDASQINDMLTDYNSQTGLDDKSGFDVILDMTIWENSGIFAQYPYLYAAIFDPILYALIGGMYGSIFNGDFQFIMMFVVEFVNLTTSMLYSHMKWKEDIKYTPKQYQYNGINCEKAIEKGSQEGGWEYQVCIGHAGDVPERQKLLYGLYASMIRYMVLMLLSAPISIFIM